MLCVKTGVADALGSADGTCILKQPTAAVKRTSEIKQELGPRTYAGQGIRARTSHAGAPACAFTLTWIVAEQHWPTSGFEARVANPTHRGGGGARFNIPG